MTANTALNNVKVRTYTFDASPTRVRRKKNSDGADASVNAKQAQTAALNTTTTAKRRTATVPSDARSQVKKSAAANINARTRNPSISADTRSRVRDGSISADVRTRSGAVSKDGRSRAQGGVSAGNRPRTAAAPRSARRSVDDIRLKRALEAVEGKKAQQKSEPKIHTVEALRRIPMPTAVIFMTFICTVLFMAMIMSFVRINEITIELESLERKEASLAKTQSELTLSLEKKNDLREIERYAIEELGMVKIDQLAKKYITLDVDEKIELSEDSKSSGNPASDLFTYIADNVRDFFKYISNG